MTKRTTTKYAESGETTYVNYHLPNAIYNALRDRKNNTGKSMNLIVNEILEAALLPDTDRRGLTAPEGATEETES